MLLWVNGTPTETPRPKVALKRLSAPPSRKTNPKPPQPANIRSRQDGNATSCRRPSSRANSMTSGKPGCGSASAIARSPDDQRGHHPEHPGRAFSMVEDVAMERPHAGLVGDDDRIPPLAGRDVQGVALEGLRQGIAVARKDLERQTVKVRRMRHRALVHEPEADARTKLRGGRERCRG